MNAPLLPDTYCRCGGANCDRKEQCVRFVDLGATGTPWTERYCPDACTSEGFIAIREEAKQ